MPQAKGTRKKAVAKKRAESRTINPKKRTASAGARTAAARRAHADAVWAHLIALYPDAHCELDYRNPWELLVATILSAQCTDKRVNMVTPVLFERYPSPRELAAANPEDVEDIIRTTGFFRAKTKSILGAAAAVVANHGGRVPEDLEALVKLPGVGRKTANVVLGNAFQRNEGVVVDTHVLRLTRLLGLTTGDDPIGVEQDLIGLFPRDNWTMLSHLLIWHGRRICVARRPKCSQCTLAGICPSASI